MTVSRSYTFQRSLTISLLSHSRCLVAAYNDGHSPLSGLSYQPLTSHTATLINSVSRFVLVSTVAVLSWWGALSDERSDVSFVSYGLPVVICQYVHTFYMFDIRELLSCIYSIYKISVSPGSVQ
jgi:hypothetical protein